MTKHIIISILPLAAALFWLITMITDKDKGDRRSILIALFGFSSIVYFCHAIFFNYLYSLYGVLEIAWVFASLMIFPVFYVYLRFLTTEEKLTWGWGWLSVPSALITLITGVLYALMSPAEIEAFVRGILYRQPGYATDSLLVQLQTMRLKVFQIVFLIQVLATLYFGLTLIREYDEKLLEYYSDTDGRDLFPIKLILILFVFISLVSAIANIMGKSFFIEHPDLLIVPSAIFTTMLTLLGYFSYKQRYGIRNLMSEPDEHTYIHIGGEHEATFPVAGFEIIDIPANDSLKDQIKYLLDTAKIYKLKDLRINDLSDILKTNRTYLSQVIRDDFNTNFSELINRYRAQYAAKLLEADASANSLTMDEIASMSGFSSKSSFFRIFKENNGVTPGKYKSNAV